MSHRQRQAAETRERVTRAARRVFAERGYGAATIADVARAAGVAVPTVYKLYGNKRALLAAVSDAWARQFVPQQPEDVPAEPAAAIAWWAATVRRQWELGLDIGMIYAGAVASQPEVREDLEPRLEARDRAITSVCEVLGPALKRAVTPLEAAAIMSAVTVPEVYRDLVRDRGWTPGKYQAWVEQTLSQLLLAP